MKYSLQTPVSEPIEIHIAYHGKNTTDVLVASITEAGVIRYSLTPSNADTPLSLSFLQAKGAYPRKVVPGWQAQVVKFVESGLGSIQQVL